MMKLSNMKELYSAWIKLYKPNDEIEFRYSAMKVKKYHSDFDALEMYHSYFTSRNYSTAYFTGDMLGKEYQITEDLKVFYSLDKNKCIEWLNEERNKNIELHKKELQKLERSSIQEEKD